MSWLVVAAAAVMVAPLVLFSFLAAGSFPGWLSPWSVFALLGISVAGFLAAAIADLASFGLFGDDQ